MDDNDGSKWATVKSFQLVTTSLRESIADLQRQIDDLKRGRRDNFTPVEQPRSEPSQELFTIPVFPNETMDVRTRVPDELTRNALAFLKSHGLNTNVSLCILLNTGGRIDVPARPSIMPPFRNKRVFVVVITHSRAKDLTVTSEKGYDGFTVLKTNDFFNAIVPSQENADAARLFGRLTQ